MLRSVLSRQSIRASARRHLSAQQQHQHLEPRVKKLITDALEKNKLVVFMKGNPGYPMCGFSRLVIQILDVCGVPREQVKAFNVLDDDDLRQGIKVFSEWPTIPQVYIGGEFVGGSDILRSMYESGELQALLREHGLLPNHQDDSTTQQTS